MCHCQPLPVIKSIRAASDCLGFRLYIVELNIATVSFILLLRFVSSLDTDLGASSPSLSAFEPGLFY